MAKVERYQCDNPKCNAIINSGQGFIVKGCINNIDYDKPENKTLVGEDNMALLAENILCKSYCGNCMADMLGMKSINFRV